VLLGQGPGAGPDPPFHELVVDLLAVGHDLGDRLAGHQPQRLVAGLGDRVEVLGAAHAEGQLLPAEPEQVLARDEPAAGHALAEEVDRCAADHRVVDVEERRGRRVRWDRQAVLDLGGCR
jgi:hypothetical protein